MYHVPYCEPIPDPLQNGCLVTEVLKNRPNFSLNFSVTCRRVPIQDVTWRHMQEDGNILPHRGADIWTCTNTYLPTPYLPGCFVTSGQYTCLDHKKPQFCHTHIWIFSLLLTKKGTLTHILSLKRFFLQIMYAPLTIDLTQRSDVQYRFQ